MFALFLILNDESKLDTILEGFFELGLGATVADSKGMGKTLINHDIEIPVFSSLRKLMEGDRPYNKTIISVIRDQEKLEKAKNIVNKELNHLNKPGVGFMFVVPVVECYGFGVDSPQI